MYFMDFLVTLHDKVNGSEKPRSVAFSSRFVAIVAERLAFASAVCVALMFVFGSVFRSLFLVFFCFD